MCPSETQTPSLEKPNSKTPIGMNLTPVDLEAHIIWAQFYARVYSLYRPRQDHQLR